MRGSKVARACGALAAALVSTLLAGQAVAAAPSWKVPMTVKAVRGIPDPMVAMDRTGRAILVFADAPFDADARQPGIYVVARGAGSTFTSPQRLGDGTSPRVAANPDGAIAIAWADGGRVQVLLQEPSARFGTGRQIRRSIDADDGVGDLRLEIDGAGRATVAWTSRRSSDGPADVQLHAAPVGADGTVGPVQDLGAPATCPSIGMDGNLAGDAAILCSSGRREIYVRPVGGESFAVEPYEPLAGLGARSYVLVDGAGAVTVVAPIQLSMSFTFFSVRPRGGAFGPRREFMDDDAVLHSQEDRTVAVWRGDGDRLTYAVRPLGGEFGPARTFGPGGVDPAPAFADVTAPLGPLPVLTTSSPDWETGKPLALLGAGIGADGAAFSTGTPTVPGRVDVPGNVAASEGGLAIATWEQRCGKGWAVMAMVLDEQRGTTDPPCQDAVAPKIAVRPKRARLVGRELRVRIGCDETCRLGVRARVLRGGRGKPLATAKTRRGQRIAAERYRTFALRLTKVQAATVRAAMARGRRVTVKLALPVSDSYGNGAVRRVAVPLRR